MADKKSLFEKELKNKLALKSSGHTSEETVLLKAFKYFDLDNSGMCSIDEFIKAIMKIGITGFNEDDIRQLFKVYDVDQSGELDYKEFVGILYSNNSIINATGVDKNKNQPQNKNQYQTQNQVQPPSHKDIQGDQSKKNYLEQGEIKEILDKIRSKLASRGVRGITSIARNFRIVDDDNSQTLDFNEFKKAAKDFRFGLNDEEIKKAFVAFDRSNNGSIDYDEFVRTIRGETNDFRKQLVEQVFEILDVNKSGYIDLEDIKQRYNARYHPDVKSGKRTEDEVLLEFLETFENTYNYLCGSENDGKVTIEEFMEYYENVSMCIDDDAYFETLMNNAWRMNTHTTGNNEKRGWSNRNEGNEARGGNESNLKDSYKNKFGDKRPGEYASNRNKNYDNQNQNQNQNPNQYYNDNQNRNYQQRNYQEDNNNNNNYNQSPIQKFRDEIKKKGGRGIIGLARAFKIFDDNNNKTLDRNEFEKALKDYKVNLSKDEIEQLFNLFDRDNSGTIDYDEFLRQVRGEMNDKRKQIVLQAFDKLDLDKSGIIELSEVKALYNAKNNKDVLSGRKTEEDVYGEFIETFETHHNLKKGYRDRRVTKDEFVEYYNNISMNIDDDDYFVAMIQNAWKLKPQPSYTNQQSWTNKNDNNDNKNVSDYYKSSNLPQKRGKMLGERNPKVGTSANAPFGTDNVPTNYSTSNNPNYNYNTNYNTNYNRNQKSNINDNKDNYDNKNKGEEVLKKFRNKMAARGTRGIMSIRRAFMIADDDNSKTVDFNEFKKFCHDYRIGLNDDEVKELFNQFDRDGSGHIDYEEFVYSTEGQMNDFRKNIVKKVFDKLDKNKNGVIELDDIRNTYNAKKHPDVVNGKKTEDEVLAEFLDTFEYHFSLLNMNKSRDGKITLDEFYEYYNNISMSIPDDRFFEAMMNSAWNLDGSRQNYGRWKGY